MKLSVKYIINEKFEFDYINKEVTYSASGEKRKVLTPAANILRFLIKNKFENDNAIVSQDELFTAGWGEKKKFVTINTFYQNILLLRKAFSELEADFEIIKNIPKIGYKLSDSISIVDFSKKDKDKDNLNNINIEKIHIPKAKEVIDRKNLKIPKSHSLVYPPKNKSFFNLSRNEIKKIIITIALMALITVFISNYVNDQRNSSSLTSYEKCGEIDNKIIFCNKQKDLNSSLLKFIAEEIIADTFNDYKYMYIMRKNFSDKLSIIYCARELGSFSLKQNECISYYVTDWSE
ncbi:winged helix-turn-helix domain-containing protein [Providencia sp. PROV130]|uniref:winged helix-turn-helix domain-containing protein n=1 Tax=Providencia sp. PROV130 TaxID=2949840 RepID=UPI00234944D0|nr:winged helix-turn-helix domain-containing protein [Providencia sp. PROV130]